MKKHIRNNTRPTKDEYYIHIATAVATRSTCLKRKYGCVIVNDDRIVATGYNGSPRGEENCCDRGSCKREDAERYRGYESCDSVHAEQNAMLCASREELNGAILYLACIKDETQNDFEWDEDVNPIPCSLCMRMIKNSGISIVINTKGIVR